MIPRDPVRNKYQPRAVELSVPRLAVAAGANLRRMIHFRIRKRLMPPFVPSPSSKHSHPIIERLFEIDAESVLDRCLEWMSRDVRFRRNHREEIINCHAVASHVGVIYKTQEAHNALLMPKHGAMEFEFDIFGVGSADVRIQVNSV